MPIADILKVTEQTAVLPWGALKPAVSRVVVNKFGMSYKKLIWCASDKFTADNIGYCQFFVNYMSGIKGEKKIFWRSSQSICRSVIRLTDIRTAVKGQLKLYLQEGEQTIHWGYFVALKG